MGRKIISILVCSLVLITALCGTVQAATHTIYDNGNISTTYITYFKDIISGISFNDNYVAFRSGQNSYTLVVGKLDYNNGSFSLEGTGKEYEFSNSTGANGQYHYYVNTIDTFTLDSENNILYSDVGDFPQLMERGAKYEILTTILLCVALLCYIISRLFRFR